MKPELFFSPALWINFPSTSSRSPSASSVSKHSSSKTDGSCSHIFFVCWQDVTASPVVFNTSYWWRRRWQRLASLWPWSRTQKTFRQSIKSNRNNSTEILIFTHAENKCKPQLCYMLWSWSEEWTSEPNPSAGRHVPKVTHIYQSTEVTRQPIT